nr:MAG TPA: hypothetical protein [Bacteriophage sp.]
MMYSQYCILIKSIKVKISITIYYRKIKTIFLFYLTNYFYCHCIVVFPNPA